MTPEEQARIDELEEELRQLKESRRSHSEFHREVKSAIPRLKSEVDHDRATDLAAIKTAYERLEHRSDRLEHLVNDRFARLEANAKLSLVEKTDRTGATTMVPASVVGAQSSRRTELWQKAATPFIVLLPVLVEIVRQVLR